MTALLNPKAVAAAVEEAKQGNVSADIISVIMMGAEAYATGVTEWGFKTLKDGLMYSTTDPALATEMSTDSPNEIVYARVGLPWVTEN